MTTSTATTDAMITSTAGANVVPATPGGLLAAPRHGVIDPPPTLWGFGGLHGGLSLGVLTAAMQEHAPGAALHSVTAQFHRALRSPFTVDAWRLRAGRTVTTVAAQAKAGDAVAVTATATFSGGPATPGAPAARPPVVSPPPPDVDPPETLAVFTIPRELAPFSEHVEVRPTDGNRPFGGGTDPTLTAWIRLVEDDAPPDLPRLMMLADALAPSVAAILPAPTIVPTVELTVRPSTALPTSGSPWILLRARTRTIGAGGWVDEHIDLWSRGGAHLASASQLRLIVPV